MTSAVFETVLSKLNKKLVFRNRKVILFFDNATCHPESMDDKFSNIKIVFLPKNTTSRLQPLDAGIIRNFKVEYRKSLVKYVLLRINDNFREGDDELMEDVHVDEEFSALAKELSSDVSPDEYVDFDAELATAEPGIKIDTLGWRQKAHDECIDSVINSAFRQVVISDESEDEVEVDKNELGPNLKETLEMLDKMFFIQC